MPSMFHVSGTTLDKCDSKLRYIHSTRQELPMYSHSYKYCYSRAFIDEAVFPRELLQPQRYVNSESHLRNDQPSWHYKMFD